MADKTITQLQLADDFLETHSLPVDNSVITERVTGAQVYDFIKAELQADILQANYVAKTANYVITDTDFVRTIGAAAPSTSFTFTSSDVDTTDNEIDETGHGLLDGDAIHIETADTMPSGLFEYLTYYVVNRSANSFSIALTPGGTEIDFTDGGSGTHTVYKALLVTLPTASANTSRLINVVKTDSNVNRVVIDGEGAEQIAGVTHRVLCTQNEMYGLQCSGTDWKVVARHIPGEWLDTAYTFIGLGSTSSSIIRARRNGDTVEIRINTNTGTPTGVPAEIRWPAGVRLHLGKVGSANDRALGYGQRLAAAGNVFLGTLAYVPFFDGRTYGCSMTFATGSNTYTAQNGNGIFASNETQDIRLSFPVAGWET